jgi:hypothetical protein
MYDNNVTSGNRLPGVPRFASDVDNTTDDNQRGGQSSLSTDVNIERIEEPIQRD